MEEFQMMVGCAKCGKENLMTLKKQGDNGDMPEFLKTIFGNNSIHYHGEVDCVCGEISDIQMTASSYNRNEKMKSMIPLFGGRVNF